MRSLFFINCLAFSFSRNSRWMVARTADQSEKVSPNHSPTSKRRRQTLSRCYARWERINLFVSLVINNNLLRSFWKAENKKKIQKIREVGFQGSSHKTQKRRRRRSEKTDKILKSSSYICTHERPFVLNICARFYLSFCVYEKRKSACRKRRTVVIIVRGRKRVFHSRLRWINFLLRFSQSKKKGSSIVEFWMIRPLRLRETAKRGKRQSRIGGQFTCEGRKFTLSSSVNNFYC